MDTVIKLNARGTIMYVDEAILVKSIYFKHLLKSPIFEKSSPGEDGTYYVDCDNDVMTELIAYMETGHFKYKKINAKYLHTIMDKYGIDREKPVKDNYVDKINTLIGKVIEYISMHIIKGYEEITVKFINCNADEIEIIPMKNNPFRKDKIMFGCKYNDKLYPLSSELLKRNTDYIYSLFKKYRIDKLLYISAIRGYKGTEIEFSRFLEDTINNEIKDDNVVRDEEDLSSDGDDE